MPRIVCTKCQTFFHPKRNGVIVEEGMPDGNGGWKPYKLWHADSLECRSCGTEIVSGFGNSPETEHFKSDYETIKSSYHIHVFVKDCL